MSFFDFVTRSALVVAVSFVLPVQAFEMVKKGDKLLSACESLGIYESNSVFSKKIKTLKFGDSITVIALDSLFELPSTDFNSKKSLESKAQGEDWDGTGPQKIDPKLYTRAAWLRVEGGYTPSSCFAASSFNRYRSAESSVGVATYRKLDLPKQAKLKANLSLKL